MTEPATVTHLKKIRVDALYGKRKHFNAATRKSRYNRWFGVALIVASVFTGSTFFALLSQSVPEGTAWAGALVSMFSLVLAAMQTFFQFEGQSTLHSRVANEFRMISKDATLTLAQYEDKIVSLEQLSEKVDELTARYNQVTASEQDCQTSDKDYKLAKKNIIVEETYTDEELELTGDNDG